MRYIDRRTGKEQNEQERWGVRVLYAWPCLPLRAVLRMRWPSTAAGWLLSTALSNRFVEAFISAHEITMNDYLVPPEGYRSFNEFFTRRLSKGARPFDNAADVICSPADSRLLAFQEHRTLASFFVKHERFRLTELVGEALAERYRNGSMLIFRLAPEDYHRFHFPCRGKASTAREITGRYESVAPEAVIRHAAIYGRNRRCVTELLTHRFGTVLIIEVGALFVGSIAQTYTPGRAEKGTEKGYFQFGGSSIVLLIEKGRIIIDADLAANTAKGLETKVRCGERVGKAS